MQNANPIKLEIEKGGGIEREVFEERTHFLILLSVIYLEGEQKSYPVAICNELFKVSKGVDVTKTSEYAKVLRFLNRWEEKGIIMKSEKKLQHNISYYLVNYNKIIERLILLINDRSGEAHFKLLDKLKYKDNEYIIAFVKLYMFFLAQESVVYYRLGFDNALLNLPMYLFQKVDSKIVKMLKYSESDAYDYMHEQEEKKLGKERVARKMMETFEEDFENDKSNDAVEESVDLFEMIPKKAMLNILFRKQKELEESVMVHLWSNDRSFDNLDLSLLLPDSADKKLIQFFRFLSVLKGFYQHGELTKHHATIVVNPLIDYIRIKFDPKKEYDELDDGAKSWEVKDLEKNIDKIHNFHFPY